MLEILYLVGSGVMGVFVGAVGAALIYKNNPNLIAKQIADYEKRASALRDKINLALAAIPKKS